MEKKEYLKAIQQSKDSFIKEQKESILKEPPIEEGIYFFKIKLPNGKSILRRFLKESKLQNIRDYLDIYFYDNNIKIETYNIVLDFPKIIFTNTIDTNNLKLKDIINSKNIILYIENLDE